MIAPDHTFRVFVSSTFLDMVEERNALHLHVFPRLRRLCAGQGLRFVPIDLRWGIRDQAALDHSAMRVCFAEVRRCAETSPGPCFLALFGDRYGWRPLPEVIPAAYMRALRPALSREDRALVDDWYLRDDNAIPPQLVLRRRATPLEQSGAWSAIEARLLAVLPPMESVAAADGPSRLGLSATEQEFLVCAGAAAADRAVAIRRRITNLDRLVACLPDAEARRYVDVHSNGQLRETALDAQRVLVEHAAAALPPGAFHDFEARWEGDRISADHIGGLPDDWTACLRMLDAERAPRNLCEAVWMTLGRGIADHRARSDRADPGALERSAHARFAEQLGELVIGRDEALGRCAAYSSSAASAPLAVVGPSGSGKSAVLARVAGTASAGGVEVFARFVGITPASSTARGLLSGLCAGIALRYGLDPFAEPDDFTKLVTAFHDMLAISTAERPLLVVIDALDQLEGGPSAVGGWLPETLPEHTWLLVSCSSEEPGSSAVEDRLQGSQLIRLGPWAAEHGEAALDVWLDRAGRTLTLDQREEVRAGLAACPRPLYLRLAFEEARRWRSFGGVPAYRGAAGLPRDIPGIVDAMFWRLTAHDHHDELLVRTSLACLAVARSGVTAEELCGALSQDAAFMTDFSSRLHHELPDDRLPPAVWSRLALDLGAHIAYREADGAAVLAFFHRQLRESAARAADRDLPGGRSRAHHVLGAFFDAQPDWSGPSAANRRKVRELPAHLIGARDWDAARRALCSPPFLEASLAAGALRTLVADLEQARQRMAEDGVTAPSLQALARSLRRHRATLSRRPDLLFQCVWNDTMSPAAESSDGLAERMRGWLSDRARREPGFPWVELLSAPQRAEPAMELDVGGRVRSLGFSPTAMLVFTKTRHDRLRAHDVLSGELRWEASATGRILVSPAGDLVATITEHGVSLWHVGTGLRQGELQHRGLLGAVAFTRDGGALLCGTSHAQVIAWDVRTRGATIGSSLDEPPSRFRPPRTSFDLRQFAVAVDTVIEAADGVRVLNIGATTADRERWRAALPQRKRPLTSTDIDAPTRAVLRIGVRPDGQTAWLAVSDGAPRLVDLRTMRAEIVDGDALHAFERWWMSSSDPVVETGGANIEAVAALDGVALIGAGGELALRARAQCPPALRAPPPWRVESPTFVAMRFPGSGSLELPILAERDVSYASVRAGGTPKETGLQARDPGLPDGCVLVRCERLRVLLWPGRAFVPHPTGTTHVRIPQSDSWLVTAGTGGCVRVWDVPRIPEGDAAGEVSIRGAEFTEDGRELVVWTDERADHYPIQGGRPSRVATEDSYASGKWGALYHHRKRLRIDLTPPPSPEAAAKIGVPKDLRMSAGGDYLIGSFRKRRSEVLRVWRMPEVRSIGSAAGARVTAFSPDGRWVVGVRGRRAIVWSSHDLAERASVEVGRCDDAIVSPDGRLLATRSGPKSVRLHALEGGRQLLSIPMPAVAIAFSPDGTFLHVCGPDYTRTYDLHGVRRAALSEVLRPVRRGADKLAAPTTQSWRDAAVLTGRLERETRYAPIAGAPGGRVFYVAAAEGTAVEARRVEDLQVCGTTSGFSGHVQHIATADDGRWVAAFADCGLLRVWEASSGRELGRVETGLGPRLSLGRSNVREVRLAPGAEMVAATHLAELRVWHLLSGERGLDIEAAGGRVDTMAFTPDGALLVCAVSNPGPGWPKEAASPRLRAWDLRSGRLAWQVACEGDDFARVIHVCSSPDGARIRTVGSSGRLDVRRAHDGVLLTSEQLLEARGSRAGAPRILRAKVSPDGRRVLLTQRWSRSYRQGTMAYLRVVDRCAPRRPMVSVGLLPTGFRARVSWRSGVILTAGKKAIERWDVSGWHSMQRGRGDVGTGEQPLAPRTYVARTTDGETTVMAGALSSGATLPQGFERLRAHPAQAIWAGVSGEDVTMFRLRRGDGPGGVGDVRLADAGEHRDPVPADWGDPHPG